MLTSKVVAGTVPVTTTMLPFLYQTKTLSYLFSPAPAFRPRHARTLPRYISTSVRRVRAFDPDKIPVTTLSPGNSAKSEAGGPSTSPTRDPNAPSAGSQRILPRILRANDNGKENTRSKWTNDVEKDFDNDFSMPTTIDFEGANIYQPRESTITYREKVAFQKIFTDIMERTQKAGPNLIPKRPGKNDPRPDKYTPGTSERAKTALNDILAGAMQNSQSEVEEAINRYPPILRADAAKAIYAGKESMSNEKREEAFKLEADEQEQRDAAKEVLRARAEELEALRAPERLRVETLMRNAQTDFELWEVMEKEVFSLISRLGLAEDGRLLEPPKPAKEKKKKGWKKLELQQEVEKKLNPNAKVEVSEPKVQAQTEEDVLPLQVHGPLYPSYLLLGLRLLDRSFAKPSPLALSILPKIKSLGFISHVLGASTQFYNDLLRIYRYRYDDFQGMIDLMQEMEQSALDMDDETITIVLDVIKMQGSVSDLERGGAVKALWKMPDFAPGRFETWKSKIARDIAERKNNAISPAY